MIKRLRPHLLESGLTALVLLAGCGSNPAHVAPNAQSSIQAAAPAERSGKPGSDDGGNDLVAPGRVRYARYLAEKANAAIADRQYDEAEQLFNQLVRIPGYEAQAKQGLSGLPARRSQSAVCLPPDGNRLVAVCKPYQGDSAQTSGRNPGDTALGRTIVEETVPARDARSASAASPRPATVSTSVLSPAELAEASKRDVPENSRPPTSPASPSSVSSRSTKAIKVAKNAAVNGETPQPPAPAQPEDPLLKRVTLEFRDASVRSVFDAITRASGLNVVFDRDISPELRTTVYLRNTTIKAAIDKIVLTSGLAWRTLDGSTLLVYADETAKQHDYQALIVRGFQLFNADAKFVATSLKTVLKFKDIIVDEKLNMIVVRDTPDAIALAEKLVSLHDVPEPEVMLEVAVLEIKKDKLKELGVAWPGSIALSPLARTRSSGTTTAADGTTTTTGTLTLRDLWNLTPGSLGMSIGNATVNLSASDANATLLANPSIRVRNREKAKILIGERVPNISSNVTSTGVTSESIAYVDVGLKLDVEPQVFPGNEIGLKLGLEVSSINSTVTTKNGVAYRIGTRTTSTVLRLTDGENQILGGLIQDTDKTAATKVPLLGDVPILGHLFRSDNVAKEKTEIVLSITPHLVRGNSRLPPEASGFNAGTISSVRGRRNEGEMSAGARLDGDSPTIAAPQSSSMHNGKQPSVVKNYEDNSN